MHDLLISIAAKQNYVVNQCVLYRHIWTSTNTYRQLMVICLLLIFIKFNQYYLCKAYQPSGYPGYKFSILLYLLQKITNICHYSDGLVLLNLLKCWPSMNARNITHLSNWVSPLHVAQHHHRWLDTLCIHWESGSHPLIFAFPVSFLVMPLLTCHTSSWWSIWNRKPTLPS